MCSNKNRHGNQTRLENRTRSPKFQTMGWGLVVVAISILVVQIYFFFFGGGAFHFPSDFLFLSLENSSDRIHHQHLPRN